MPDKTHLLQVWPRFAVPSKICGGMNVHKEEKHVAHGHLLKMLCQSACYSYCAFVLLTMRLQTWPRLFVPQVDIKPIYYLGHVITSMFGKSMFSTFIKDKAERLF